jgi:hypothetical protein
MVISLHCYITRKVPLGYNSKQSEGLSDKWFSTKRGGTSQNQKISKRFDQRGEFERRNLHLCMRRFEDGK